MQETKQVQAHKKLHLETNVVSL